MQPPGPMTKNMQDHYLEKYQEWVESNKDIDELVHQMLKKQQTTITSGQHTNTEPKDRIMNPAVNKNEQLKTETFNKDEILRLGEIKNTVAAWANRIGHHSKMVIAGGCFASLINGEQVKDVDVFFLDMQSSDYLNLIKYLDINVGKLIDRSDYTRDNDNIDAVFNVEGLDYQFIFTKYKTREELLAHFDYVHCMASYANYTLRITRKTYDAIKDKHLIVNNDKQVKQWRTEKFIGRGWSIPGDDNPLTVGAFNAMMRQPSKGLAGARINPMRR